VTYFGTGELEVVKIEGSAYIRGIQGQGLFCAPMIETILVTLENSLDFFGVLRHFNQYVR
jgi:hypothetical protein